MAVVTSFWQTSLATNCDYGQRYEYPRALISADKNTTMDDNITVYDDKVLQQILDQINTLIREGRARCAESIIEEHNLREWLCSP